MVLSFLLIEKSFMLQLLVAWLKCIKIERLRIHKHFRNEDNVESGVDPLVGWAGL